MVRQVMRGRVMMDDLPGDEARHEGCKSCVESRVHEEEPKRFKKKNIVKEKAL
jgi:hypothetical protein